VTIPKTKKTLTIHIVQEDRDKLEAAVKSLRQRTGEKTSAGKVTRDQLLKWADEELKSQINPFMLEEKKEPEMHADLIWLAENVSKWGGTFGYKHIFLEDGEADYNSEPCNLRKTFTRDQWQAARIELGLENPFAACLAEADDTYASGMRDGYAIGTEKQPLDREPWDIIGQISDLNLTHKKNLQLLKSQVNKCKDSESELESFASPEEDEAWDEAEKRMEAIGQNGNDGDHYDAPTDKQARYQDAEGEDWIDEAARTFTAEEFRGAMRFTIGKYNRRMGKKDDLISEIEKIRDYATRWLEVEQGR